jgi:hypothetical protein
MSRFVVCNGKPVPGGIANANSELELPEMWATRIRIKIYPEMMVTEEIVGVNGYCSILVPKSWYITGGLGFKPLFSCPTIADEGGAVFSGLDIDIMEMHLGNGLKRFGPYFKSIS